jgi:hypothetical protein
MSAADRERQNPLPFFLIYSSPGSASGSRRARGIYTLVAPLALTFVAVPLFDAMIGIDTRNPPESPSGPFATAIFRLALRHHAESPQLPPATRAWRCSRWSPRSGGA